MLAVLPLIFAKLSGEKRSLCPTSIQICQAIRCFLPSQRVMNGYLEARELALYEEPPALSLREGAGLWREALEGGELLGGAEVVQDIMVKLLWKMLQ